MSNRPQNGPSLSKATYKAVRRPAPTPEQKQLAMEQLARECSKTREVKKLLSAGDYRGALEKLGLVDEH